MADQRIAPLQPPYPADIAGELEKMMPPGIPPLNLFCTVARNPRILHKFRMANLLDRGSIERREREIVILRTCARCGAEYEWGVHVSFFAQRFGLSEEQVSATVHGFPDDACWSASEALLVRLVDELHDGSRISDELWSALSETWRADQIIELIALAGNYHLVSFMVNGLGLELEAGAARFPEA
ncbi:MAG: carboxymuconolactone decarboxylase family protein [Proteobacteria bacterium]|nr:carboxymuconolactone decarboxylase family protein [Pseudomonadota bacterium]